MKDVLVKRKMTARCDAFGELSDHPQVEPAYPVQPLEVPAYVAIAQGKSIRTFRGRRPPFPVEYLRQQARQERSDFGG